MITRFKDGAVTVTLSGDLEQLVQRAVDAAGGAIVAEMKKVAEETVRDAEGRWYTDVTKRTGKSGDWDVMVTVSNDEVRVGVQTLDDRVVKSNGARAAFFVHRAGPLSMIERKATHEDFKTGRAKASPRGERIPGRGVIEVPNPKASDGKYLLQELIRRPFKLKVKAVTPELARLIVERVRKGA